MKDSWSVSRKKSIFFSNFYPVSPIWSGSCDDASTEILIFCGDPWTNHGVCGDDPSRKNGDGDHARKSDDDDHAKRNGVYAMEANGCVELLESENVPVASAVSVCVFSRSVMAIGVFGADLNHMESTLDLIQCLAYPVLLRF